MDFCSHFLNFIGTGPEVRISHSVIRNIANTPFDTHMLFNNPFSKKLKKIKKNYFFNWFGSLWEFFPQNLSRSSQTL